MIKFFPKTFTHVLRVILVLVIGLTWNISPALARDKMQSDCPIHPTMTVDKTEVNSWADTVKVKIAAYREPALGYYCATDDVVKLRLSYIYPNGPEREYGTVTFQFQSNATGVGKKDYSRDFDFDLKFSTLGVPQDAARVVLGLNRTARRTEGYKVTELGPLSAPIMSVVQLKGATQPTGNPTGGQSNSNSNTNSGNLNTSSNTNTSRTFSNLNTTIGINQNTDYDQPIGYLENLLEFNSIPALIVRLLQILFALIGIVTTIILMLAAFKLVTQGDNETERTKAKKAITWAIIGLVVSLMSFSIVAIVQRLIT